MKTNFWLLDIGYEVLRDNPEIRLWGIDDNGNRVLILDRSLIPYFYLVPEETGIEALCEQVAELRNDLPHIVDVYPVEKKILGKPIKALKVECRNPDELSKYANSLKKALKVKSSFEDDMRFSMRYLIDKEVSPCSWMEFEVEEIENKNFKIDRVYIAKSNPKQLDRLDRPKFRILSFDITIYGVKGATKSAQEPIIIISAMDDGGISAQFIAEDKDDKTIIEKFIEFVNEIDPDILVGYGSNQENLPYIISRAEKYCIRLSLNRNGGAPHRSVYGHISLTGRANIDLYDFSDDFTQVKIKSLENIARFLGVLKIDDSDIIEDFDVPAFWDSEEKRHQLLRFSENRAKMIMQITQIILDNAIQLSMLVGLPLDHVGTAATGFKVEWYLMRHAHRIGELFPNRLEQPYYTYEGGLVLTPKPGIHNNIAVLDFKSMYPNIMIAKNISPDTLLQPGDPEPPEGVWKAPQVGYRFRRDRMGFYNEVLAGLIKRRSEVSMRMKGLNEDSFEYKMLNSQQQAIKLITNATYGYAGWLGARWYSKGVAEATAAWGRETIKDTIKLADEMGLEVIYGDTDSIFVVYDQARIVELLGEVKKKLGLEIKPDTIYKSILFTEAKKRYCGLLLDGRLDIVGLEVIRGDWAEVSKKVQEDVLGIVLREGDVQKAVKAVKKRISELREQKIPYKDLIIWKTLTKPIEKYKVKASHVEAALMLKEAGWTLSVGDKIGYVITLKGDKLYEKAKPYNFATYSEIDLDYYIESQIKPVALRILKQFNICREELN
ncbi:MAG: DNA-directed DNA polymerase [Candidatus Bathyarchaeia archaeon]